MLDLGPLKESIRHELRKEHAAKIALGKEAAARRREVEERAAAERRRSDAETRWARKRRATEAWATIHDYKMAVTAAKRAAFAQFLVDVVEERMSPETRQSLACDDLLAFLSGCPYVDVALGGAVAVKRCRGQYIVVSRVPRFGVGHEKNIKWSSVMWRLDGYWEPLSASC